MTISSDGLLKLKPERFIARQPLVCHEVSVGQGDIRLSDTDQISAVNPSIYAGATSTWTPEPSRTLQALKRLGRQLGS